MKPRKLRRIYCVVCDYFRHMAYQSDTGPVCDVCAAVEQGRRPPEKWESDLYHAPMMEP